MPNFKYKARDKFGKLTTGLIEKESQNQVAHDLISMGYSPITIELDKKPKSRDLFIWFKKIRLVDLNFFTRQFLALQKAGLTITESLEAISNQTKNRKLKTTLKKIEEDIISGLNLSDALSRHPKIFNELYINMIRAGERSGKLPEILQRLLNLIDLEIDTRQKIRQATLWPKLTLASLIFAFFIIVTFVIPRFSAFYSHYHAILPLPTRVMIWLNLVINRFWLLFIFITIAAILSFIKFINTKFGRHFWDNFRLKFPVFGPLILMISMSRFARIASILMSSGLPILEVLDITRRTSGNVIVAEAISKISDSIDQGKGLSEPMRISGIFSPVVVNMVAVGERTGSVDELLLDVADYYDQEIQYIVTNLTTFIEPILIIVLAFMVLLLALAVYLPMWNLINVLKPV